MRFLLRTIVLAFALWVTTLLVPGITVTPWQPGTLETVLTFLLVAALFSIVNGTVGVALKVLSFPLYILTLGLFGLVVNGLMLLLVAWLSGLIGFGLAVGGFWWGVWAALILGVVNGLIGLIVRPARR
ncbi:MAG TPA: phage holin family protein [Microbacteriaceae bacterium]|nr:phage holin family protein [Microbacteriaceae bacterium]